MITTDGCFFVGILEGFDGPTNIVLRQAEERILSREQGQIRPLGLYILRGEMVATIGLVNQEVDAQIDWTAVRAEPLGTTRHKR